jgi:hypothetical protein
MSDSNNDRSTEYPDEFDRMLGVLDGVSTATLDATIPVVPVLGVGGTRKFIVRTVRHEGKDHLFVEMIARDRHFREYFPPEVTATIARQRDALTTKNRRAAAKQAARTRKQRGIAPAFLRPKAAAGGDK